jgi:precorrin-3B synthase
MATGDGLLVRLVTSGLIPLDAFIRLCAAAQEHGNGTMEISARGSLQIRGLNPVSAPLFAAEVAGLDIAVSEGVPVIDDPLPEDPDALLDAESVAGKLREAVAGRALRLAPKVSVIVDGGGRVDLDALFADVRLRAVATREGAKFQLALAGDARSATAIGTVSPEGVVDAVIAVLELIAAQGPEARASDLLRTELQLPLEAPVVITHKPREDVIGIHLLEGGAFALGLGVAFGHAQAPALSELARIAKTNGAGWARPAPGRALLLGPLSETAASALATAGGRLGLVTEADDPRRRIAACPGAPACSSGLIAARALAAEIARHVPLAEEKGIALHVSGCAKGCAHPAPAPLTVVGTEKGCGIVHDGTARATPTATLDPSELVAALRRTETKTREAMHA